MGNPLNLIKRFGRTQAIRRNIAGFAFDLLFDTGDADLGKFVQVRAENAKKLYSLDQRLGRVLRLFEDSSIELEPAQLAVDEILRIAKALVRGLLAGHRHNRRALLRLGLRLRLRHTL